jgi:hypothetical protein
VCGMRQTFGVVMVGVGVGVRVVCVCVCVAWVTGRGVRKQTQNRLGVRNQA